MKELFILALTLTLFACSTNKELPKAPIVKDTERTIKKAEIAFISGEPSADELIKNALSLSLATNIPNLKIRSLLLKTSSEIKKKQLNEAIKSLENAKELAQNEDPQMIPYTIYFDIILSFIKNDEENLKSLLEAKIDYPKDLIASATSLKAIWMIKHNKFDEAMDEIKIAYNIAKKQNQIIEQSFLLKLSSYINLQKNNIEDAQKDIEKALIIDRSLYLIDYLYWDLEMLGKIYAIKNNKEKSLYYYKSAYELALSNKNKAKAEYFNDKISQLLK
jgi:hypothetical protein